MSAETVVFIDHFPCKNTPHHPTPPFLLFHHNWNKTKRNSGNGEGSIPAFVRKTKACCRTEEGNYKNLNNQCYKRKKRFVMSQLCESCLISLPC